MGNGTQTLARALDILFALAEAESTLSVSEIAERVSIPESTTYRLLQTLEQNGVVERRAKGRSVLDFASWIWRGVCTSRSIANCTSSPARSWNPSPRKPMRPRF